MIPVLGCLAMAASGQDVIKFGTTRFAHRTGSANTGVGFNAGAALTPSSQTAVGNTLIGHYAGAANNTGGNNTFIGDVAGANTTSGHANVAVGRAAGYTNTIGQENTWIGTQAGALNTQGNFNTFLGRSAGVVNTLGNNNTFVGRRAGAVNTTGTDNVFIGAESTAVGPLASSLQNVVALGTNAKVAVSNAIVLGDTLNPHIKVGIGTASPRYPLDVKGAIHIRGGSNGPGQLLFSSRTFLEADEKDFLVLSGGRPGESGLRFAHLKGKASELGGTRHALSVDAQGRVGLYPLALTADQVRLQVTDVSQWADFVFSPGHPTRSIRELADFIAIHQHLPSLPPAQEMVSQGRSLQGLMVNLVQAQEEQALYTLQLQAENERLGRETQALREELQELKRLVQQLQAR
ncbi:hypothetical protein GCM10027275_10220 [Rhabdobacter roseus]